MQPGEQIQDGINDIRTVLSNQALLVQANNDFTEVDGTKRKAGEQWLVRGPTNYLPPLEVSILEPREEIALSHMEGIYVKNRSTGKVQSVRGKLKINCTRDLKEIKERVKLSLKWLN